MKNSELVSFDNNELIAQDDAISPYLGIMDSLDKAFIARRRICGPSDSRWGEAFFRSIEEAEGFSGDNEILFYAAASHLLNYFAWRREMEDYAWVIRRNPANFANTINMMLRHGMLP